MRRRLALSLALMLPAGLALAQQPGANIAANGSGSISIASVRQPVREVLLQQQAGGKRMTVTTATRTGSFAFSGTMRVQPRERTVDIAIAVDSVTDSRGEARAAGSCTASLSPDGTVLHGVSCQAKGRNGAVALTFTAAGITGR